MWDYLDDAKLWFRLNQVMHRVGLPALPERFCRLLPKARQQVAARSVELLTPHREDERSAVSVQPTAPGSAGGSQADR